MTRLLTCGYETGDVNEAGISTIQAQGAMAVATTGPTPRGGSYYLKLTSNATITNSAYKTFAFPAAKTEVWIRWAVYVHIVTASESVIAVLLDSAALQVSCVTYSSVDGLLRVRQGGTVSGTVLGASSVQMTVDAWHALEWRHQMTSLTVGISELWLDNNRVVNFSGDNSQSGALLNVQSFALGNYTTAWGAASYSGIDDIAVNDTAGTLNNGRPGDGRVVLLLPNGAGTAGTSGSALVRGGTDTGANYSQVNEIPPSLVQYVGSSTVGDRDLYTIADLPVAVSSINVIEAIVLAQNSDAGAGQIAPTIKSGATINEATAIGLGTSAGYVGSRWETDPLTTVAWTAAGVNALEAGVTVR